MKQVQTSPAEPLSRRSVADLIEEIERYLDAVALFRALGHEPRWRREPWSEGPVIALVAPYIDHVSPV